MSKASHNAFFFVGRDLSYGVPPTSRMFRGQFFQSPAEATTLLFAKGMVLALVWATISSRLGNVMQLAHTFEEKGTATLYHTRMLLGADSGPLKPVSHFIRNRRFPSAKAGAWLKHNVEEVGAFEEFLPSLYYQETGRRS